MRITKEAIDSVKRSADLIEVVESHGVRLKKKGQNYVGLCPFHKEKTPSFTVNPKTNLWHCFGCRAGGDVIGFICKMEGVSFKEAMEKLNGNGRIQKPGVRIQKNGNGDASRLAPHASVDCGRLLNRVVSFYHQSFLEDGRAREYLEKRGIKEKSIFTDFKIGFANGTLLNTIPDACPERSRREGDIQEALREIGILNDKGHEMFYGSVVFPLFNENQDCVGLYGRRITDGEVNHLFLPGPRRGLFNWQAAKRSPSLILTESIIDALTLYQHGFKEVIPCYGVNGLTEDHLSLFVKYQTKEIHICFDSDDAGREGAKRIAEQLQEKGIMVYLINLPVSESAKVDLNSFFLLTADAASVFAKLLAEANPSISLQPLNSSSLEPYFEKTDAGFIVHYGDLSAVSAQAGRRYEVKGIIKEGVKLRATIKAAPAVLSGAEGPVIKQRFHLDTVDLYSNRSRLFFTKAAAQLFSEKEEAITEDLLKLIDLAEAWKPEEKEKSPTPAMTRTEEDEALEFLKDPDLFNRLLEDFEALGMTGEEPNKLIGYLSAVSRKLDEPLSVLIQSRSAAGKSTLQDSILSLIPPEDFVKYTRLTGQALFYKEENSLVHKCLAIEEEEGARDASYSIRNIQSSKYLSIAATGKDPVTGKLRTEEYRVKGPVALMITTTEVAFDDETSNRFVTLTIDESREMTERILQRQREQDTLEGLIRQAEAERIMKKHQNAQRLLRPLKVINPYASHLTFPSDSLRARRDHKKYLSLIKAIAFLHQYQREIRSYEHQGEVISYIEVTLDDIEKANSLANEILGRTLDEISPPARSLLKIIREMVLAKCAEKGMEPKDYRFTRRDIREWTKWSDFQVKCHIRQLEDLEYLYSIAGKKGKEYIYELLYSGQGENGKPFFLGLIPIAELREKIAATNLGGQNGHLGGSKPHLGGAWAAEVRQ